MENVRLLNQLRQRTADLTRSLQQPDRNRRRAQVISRSTFNLQAVLQVLIENATHVSPGRVEASSFNLTASMRG